ncbi:MAG: ABC transporter substrate-binding protein [Anaerolineae bacterium]|jgi:peptide/nickel transport system substrate-binding protein|nr:ABC transporter substrate-binding protein [Anaerolineae bacterium]
MLHKSRLALLGAVMSLLIVVIPSLAQSPDDTTLVIAQSVDVGGLEPSVVGSRAEANIFGHMFGTLYEITEDGSINPYLAQSYTVSEDGTEWSFTLNEGLTCHDGAPLTADDVVYTFQRAADPANAFTGNTVGFVMPSVGYVDARVDSDLVATIITSRYQSIGLGLLAEVYIHCRESYEGKSLEEAAQNPVGSGPYRFVEWVPDDYVLIERVEGFNLTPANFERIYWRVIPEASTRVAELIAGNVDIIANVPADQIPAIDASGGATVKAVQGTRRMYVGFQFSEEFADSPGWDAIQNRDVRVALQYAIDVPTICVTLLGTECERASSMVNPPNNNPNLTAYPYDPVRAGELLDAAGYPADANGVRFEITLMGPRGRYLNDANVVQAIAQYLTDVGVVTTVDIRDWSSDYVPLVRQKQVGPLFFLGTGGGTWNALYDMADLSAPDAGTNYTNWQNEEWFTLWNSLGGIREPEAEREVINQMLEIFYNDPPWLLLYFQPDFYGVSNRIDWQPRRDEKLIVKAATLSQ